MAKNYDSVYFQNIFFFNIFMANYRFEKLCIYFFRGKGIGGSEKVDVLYTHL